MNTSKNYVKYSESLLIFVVSMLCAGFCFVPQSVAQEQPNIIVIMTDDQADIETTELMPGLLNKIASKGISFTRSYVDFPLCTPSRASFLTGLAAHNHGVLGNNEEDGGGYLRGSIEPRFKDLGWEYHTLALWLQEIGYSTIMIGKYMNGSKKDPTNVPPGWDTWIQKIGKIYYDYELNRNGVLEQYGSDPEDYITDVYSDEAIKAIKHQDGPFFMLLNQGAPHGGKESFGGNEIASPAPRHVSYYKGHAMPQPPNFNEADILDKPTHIQERPQLTLNKIKALKYEYRRAKESLLAVDDTIRRIVKVLKRRKILNKTYIVFTSDHGYTYGNHRLTSKRSPYLEAIRVPLLARGPGIPENATRDHMVNNLDLVASIVSFTGASADHELDGHSLIPLITNPDTPWRDAILFQGSFNTPDGIGRYSAVQTERYTYVENTSDYYGDEAELYDLETDPYQLENRAGDPAYIEVESELEAILADLRTCSGDSCWVEATFAEPELE